MKPILVHAPDYDITMLGVERLHPFDGRKFSRAWAVVERRLGSTLGDLARRPHAPVGDEELLRVHTRAYLDSLRSPQVVAAALELALLRVIPRALIERFVLRPMRWAVAGTVLAMQEALAQKGEGDGGGRIAMNLGGGFHHAFRDHGEGFCLYADVAVALAAARATGALGARDPIAVIDLDAHRGNGFWAIHGADPAVRVLDVYNFQAYPGLLAGEPEATRFQIPIKAGTGDDAYLAIVREELPRFFAAMPPPRLAVYNAGTDILSGDRVGRLAISAEGVRTRDRLVVAALVERGIPAVIVTSGGYTDRSHALVADLALTVVEQLRG